ncbi:hypothetical protein CONPUDRAFT_162055 [Coniophora puteana RWD-64-598 SS2]|uniref:Uncharacterized protein n=1 Tax=Coniophora puteana (strain RWD-64-598) TaxID=741705 RepID=A0A5M3N0B7_CONPW|nr:uncharacterized protein CONPUDRAFT_162055 [Coniophora puteana RWD-64-598 SS2]EIW84697.1 hypothetical protein CONPUDRAFT_162055 [Coniophora puteana RWD-64-598 SS2]
MRFFSTVSLVFTAALAAFSVAAPAAEEAKVVARQSTTSIASIFSTAFTEIAPLAESLVYLNSDNATQAVITPIISQISAPLNTALTSVTALQGQGLTQDQLLLSEDGTEVLSVAALAQLIAFDLILLFKGLGAILSIVGADLAAILIPLLYAVGILVYKILVIVLALVVGLLIALTPLLGSIVGVLNALGLTVLLVLLAL